MNELPQRKKLRLERYDYTSTGAYFVTICVKDKHELLGTINVGATVPGRPCVPYVELSDIGYIVDTVITNSIRRNISIPKYIIMPDHIHMIIEITDSGDRGRSPLQMVVRSMKSYITKQDGFSFWQRSFYDHIIRDEAEYQAIWKYIDENPLRWVAKYYPG